MQAAPSLEDIGVTKAQSSRWQAEASLPEEDFEKYIEETKAAGEELTQASVLGLVKARGREKKRSAA